jgi:hypothetical protein
MNRFFLSVGCLLCTLITLGGNDNTPLGARSSAIGGASVTLDDVWATQNNQAALASMRNFSAGAFYENKFLLKELSSRAAAVVMPIKIGTIATLIHNFGYSQYQENKYSISFAKAFDPKFSMGIAMDWINIQLGDNQGKKNIFTSELGIFSKPLKNLTLGAHIFNPARIKLADYNNERLATILKLGGNYLFSKNVLMAIEAEKDISKKVIFKTGIEYRPVNQLYLRIGLSTNPILSSFGFGFNIKNVQLDVSAKYHQILGFSPQLGILYTHNKKQDSSVTPN